MLLFSTKFPTLASALIEVEKRSSTSPVPVALSLWKQSQEQSKETNLSLFEKMRKEKLRN